MLGFFFEDEVGEGLCPQRPEANEKQDHTGEQSKYNQEFRVRPFLTRAKALFGAAFFPRQNMTEP